MKFSIALAVFIVVAACLATQTIALSPAPGGAAPELHLRSKRATCDLLSGTGVNHSACAAHCVLRGNSGGYCNAKAVCICRK